MSLCGDLPGAWFAEATGKTGLKSSVEVERGSTQNLPFRWDAQHPFEASTIKCHVLDGDDVLVEFAAGLQPADELGFYKGAVTEYVEKQDQFTAAGAKGSIDVPAPPATSAYGYWFCGSSTLRLSITKFASDDKAGITKQLTTRIAERIGCTKTYTRPTPTPSS